MYNGKPRNATKSHNVHHFLFPIDIPLIRTLQLMEPYSYHLLCAPVNVSRTLFKTYVKTVTPNAMALEGELFP
jgi:hypothetical protein